MRNHEKRLNELEQVNRYKDVRWHRLIERYPGQSVEEARREAGLPDDCPVIFRTFIEPNHSYNENR
jgi:hypothetical protein